MGAVISQGQPAYTNDFNAGLPSRAVDALYGTEWTSAVNPTPAAPVWLAVDLSAVPTNQRGNVTFFWFNEKTAYFQNPEGSIGAYTSIPADYTIEANTAAGGGAAPTTGWDVLKTVAGNVYTSREHRINLAGYNWVRMVCTANKDTSGIGGLNFQIDIYTQPYDDFLCLGDSITEEAQGKHNIAGGDWNNGPIPVQVHALDSTHYPLMIDGGSPTMTMAWAATNIAALLSGYEGTYVSVSYGTNDLNQSFAMNTAAIQAVYANLITIINAIEQASKVAIVPKVPYGTANSGFLGTNADAFNQYVAAHLPTDKPNSIIGPDLYTPFFNDPTLLRDGIHPTFSGANCGYDVYHSTWANWLVANYPNLPSPPQPQFKPAIIGKFTGAKTKIQAVFVRKPMTAQENSTVDSTVTLSHSDGSAFVVSTIAVAVTFPDGTISNYTLAAGDIVGAGTSFTLTYKTKAVGTHIEDWTITDSNGATAEYHVYTSAIL